MSLIVYILCLVLHAHVLVEVAMVHTQVDESLLNYYLVDFAVIRILHVCVYRLCVITKWRNRRNKR